MSSIYNLHPSPSNNMLPSGRALVTKRLLGLHLLCLLHRLLYDLLVLQLYAHISQIFSSR